MFKVGITGGIGSGKSTLCRRFAARGVAVYDTDAAAKRLMNDDVALRRAICDRFGAESYTAEGLNRSYLAERVFGDAEERKSLNRLVHPAVIADFERWAEEQQGDYVVLESAILFEAGLADHLDCIVAVLAPERVRIERAMQRDGASEEQIRSRMAAQIGDDELRDHSDVAVVNLFEEELDATVQELDRRFKLQANNELR